MELLDYFAREDTKTPYALAKYLNINAANVYGWLKSGRPVPVAHCPKIEEFTNGAVTCEELLPSFNWAEVWDIYRRRNSRREQIQ